MIFFGLIVLLVLYSSHAWLPSRWTPCNNVHGKRWTYSKDTQRSFDHPGLTTVVYPVNHLSFKFESSRVREAKSMVRMSVVDSSSCSPAPSATGEKYAFESNVARVMDIIINSLYSNKDVFLRELISNAADACDKKRFLTIKDGLPPGNLGIRVSADREANTLTIEDRGIGMNKEDLIENLGKIAESGTKKFMDTATKDKRQMDDGASPLSLIGQFGVGFYSGFLVANKITVVTKGSSGEQWRWEANSNTLNEYTIQRDEESDPIENTGTRIILSLKDESDQYLDDHALKVLIEKYSEFISFPIELQKTVSRPESVPDLDAPPTSDGNYPMKSVVKKIKEWILVNNKKPLWLRPPKECKMEEYEDFYKQTFRAYDKPMAYSHFSVEGSVDFKAMIFLPSEIPYEISRDMFSTTSRSMRLYVKRVFINDNFHDLIPRWLLFLRGMVDSEDLPLNVGREILQQSRSLRIIKQKIVRKALEMISAVANDHPDDYHIFWKNFGKYLKVGIIEDESNKEALVPLCRFHSTTTASDSGSMTSLTDYVKRMPSEQKNIYYVVGETRAQAAASPALEILKKKGYEVLLLAEPIDEMMLQNIDKFEGKVIVDAAKESPKDMSAEEKQEKEVKNLDSEDFRRWMKQVLGEKITRVEASTRLVDSPAMIVQSEYGVSPNMQKYLRAQAVAENDESVSGKGSFSTIFNQAVLEINLEHPIIKKLRQMYDTEGDSNDGKERVLLLFSTAALAGGYVLDNSAEYAQMVVNMLTQSS